METRLIRVGPEAAPALAALHAAAFAEGAWNQTQLAQSLAQTAVFGFALENTTAAPQAFILCQLAGDDAEILTFCTAPAARRNGLGARLLTAALDEARARGASRMFLEVAEDNEAALALYLKAGFAQVGQRKNYYRRIGHATDAAILEKQL